MPSKPTGSAFPPLTKGWTKTVRSAVTRVSDLRTRIRSARQHWRISLRECADWRFWERFRTPALVVCYSVADFLHGTGMTISRPRFQITQAIMGSEKPLTITSLSHSLLLPSQFVAAQPFTITVALKPGSYRCDDHIIVLAIPE